MHVNTYGGADMTVPLGGIKQSGNGHDKSPHALDRYIDLKTAWIQLWRASKLVLGSHCGWTGLLQPLAQYQRL